MPPLNPRRRRKVAGGIVRGSLGLLVLLLTGFALHHPVTVVLSRIAQLGRPGTGADDDRGSRDSRSLTEDRLQQDAFFSANASLVDEIAHLGNVLLHPPKEPDAAAGSGKRRGVGCLPDAWTGNSHDYNLTREAIACVADDDNVVMVTWANWHYADFVRNWVEHVQSAGITSFLVGAMDDKLLEALAADGVATFSMASGLTTDDFGWGSATFHKMGREKIGLINTFTGMNISILVSDVDTVWMRDPLPFMAQYPQADVLTSSDHLRETAADGGLEWPQEAGSPANIGIMLVRAHARAFAKEWLDAIVADDKYWDQNAFNDLMRRGAVFEPRRGDRLFLGYDGKFKFGILPVATFCSGHTFFVQRMPAKLGLDAYVAHATFQYSGTPGKRHRFREALLWNDPPEYFNGSFLAYTPDIPSELLRAATPPNREHPPQNRSHIAPQFDLIHHQYAQLRSAWAIAQALNRTLVLPELWSGQDRYWAPHNGRLPGSGLELPFLAPADHIIDLESMARADKPEDHFGPHMDWREHSFLRNARMPPDAKRSRVRVVVCRPEDDPGPCADGSGPADEVRGRVHLRPGLNDAQMQTALQRYTDRSIMVFDTMLGAFGGFAEGDVTQRFHNRMKEIVGLFCCIDEQPRGNVFYDMLFDVVPHTDRFDRTFDKPWEITMGP